VLLIRSLTARSSLLNPAFIQQFATTTTTAAAVISHEHKHTLTP